MRTFVSINASGDARQEIGRLSGALRQQAQQGNFTRVENLHLTLVFLGENSQAAAVGKILEELQNRSFALRFSKLGRFQRSGGDLCWLGAEWSPELLALQKELDRRLRAIGFRLEDREFTPHLTLGREVRWKPGVQFADLKRLVTPFIMPVERVSLMKSERVNGVLTYTELTGKILMKG